MAAILLTMECPCDSFLWLKGRFLVSLIIFFPLFHQSPESPKATAELSLNLGKFGTMTVAESEVEADSDLEIFPYERLKVTSDNPIKGINVTKREVLMIK